MSYCYSEEPNFLSPRPSLALAKLMVASFASSPNSVALETARSVSSCGSTTSTPSTSIGSTATPTPSAVFPRSASEASCDNSTNNNKYRQLPCRTFISVGTCPYRERCVYLHDPRCICREAKTKTRRKNKDDTMLDGVFWPIMPFNLVSQKLDTTRQPHVIQNYVVPVPQQDQYRKHDQAVYSMWMHFVDFCQANADSQATDKPTVFSAPDLPVNAYTKTARLAIFRQLSSPTSSSAPSTKSKTSNADSSVTPMRTPMVVHVKEEVSSNVSMRQVQVPVLHISRLDGLARHEEQMLRPPMTTKSMGASRVRSRESFDSLDSLSTADGHSRRSSIDSSHDDYSMYLESNEVDSDARTSPDCSNSAWGSTHSKDFEVHMSTSYNQQPFLQHVAGNHPPPAPPTQPPTPGSASSEPTSTVSASRRRCFCADVEATAT